MNANSVITININSIIPGWLSDKESACQCRRCKRHGSVAGLGRPPGVGKGKPLQYYCLGNSMDRGAWQAIVHGVTKNWT